MKHRSNLYDNDEFRRMKRDVRNAYPTDSWKWRVDHMKGSQIIAIWFNMQKKKKTEPKEEKYKQITLFDICPEAMLAGR